MPEWKKIAEGVVVLDTPDLPLVSIKIVDQASRDKNLIGHPERFFWILDGFGHITTGRSASLADAKDSSLVIAAMVFEQAIHALRELRAAPQLALPLPPPPPA